MYIPNLKASTEQILEEVAGERVMYIPNLKWSVAAVLEVVDDTELVMVQKERYLGVWHGDLYARVYDLTAHPSEGFAMLLLSTSTVFIADQTITQYVNSLQDGIPEYDLTH